MFVAKLDRLLWRIPAEIPAHEQSRKVATSSSSLRIRDSGGNNQALVFLCDPPITIEAYDELIASFQPRYRVVVIELPCFGFSTIKEAFSLTFDGAVREVEAVIKSLDLDSCILFGPCVCGFVATELAARAKLPIKGLVLMQTPDRQGMLSWVARMDPNGLLRVPVLGQLIVKFTARRIAKFWLRYATAKEFDSTGLESSSDLALTQGGGYPLASMLQLWTNGTKNANLEVPALVIWGKQDRSHKETSSGSTRKHVPHAELIEFFECGHFTELEQPRKFAVAVAPFVAQNLVSENAE